MPLLVVVHSDMLKTRGTEYRLFINIGNKLGDETCKELMEIVDCSALDLEAKKWIKVMHMVHIKYSTQDIPIATSDLAWAKIKLPFFNI